ncbi:MAG: SAM-dependent methyltransferase [Bacteroidales bacterium]|nr:SAM-dependent methyltransferase [Bacteroidales bacterium]
MKGKLYLLPSPLGDGPVEDVLPRSVLEAITRIRHYIVEEERTVRRFLSKAGLRGHIEALRFYPLNEHTAPETIESYLKLFEEGCDVGLISEAGLPAVADPGAALVALCHTHGIEVLPFVGPSSLMLALMGSGLNGQCFAFKGYLPAKNDARKQAIRTLEKRSKATGETQIFIETPYRNDAMLADLLASCADSTRLCLAINLTCPDQCILTHTLEEWKKEKISIGKRPCVFLMLA